MLYPHEGGASRHSMVVRINEGVIKRGVLEFLGESAKAKCRSVDP
ncbi:MAG: hypothetical protein A4E64_01401 [Syntrophorhabdus sp. PtaU1.Bin058]|nr:MAG: hypothetical protein A4E64_01401 [Syntrophorhabdus sp. PtaU1.Bin058]